MTTELTPRAQTLLKTLVEAYIREGQPVGSRALARESGLELSPATVRNIMLDLEEMGLVVSPHTSAGRLPTVKGYRVFVNSLLTMRPLTHELVQRLQGQMRLEGSISELMGATSALLSDLTRMAGVVMLPRREQTSLRQIEFLGLSDNRVLAIIVLNDGEVQNRIIRSTRRFSAGELQQAGHYLTAALTGKDPFTVRHGLLAELRATRDALNDSMQEAIGMAEQVFTHAPQAQPDYVLAGQTNLMEFAQFSHGDTLRQLFTAFSEKQSILQLLDQCLQADGVQIFIGEESGYKALDACSVVTAPYVVDGEVVGVLGVIGPTRMPYEQVIPLVDITAKLLGSVLNQR